MSKQVFRWFLLGLLIRIIIIPFFAHPDIFWINLGPSNLTDNIYNIYQFHGDKKDIHLFKYPPLTYYILGFNYKIFSNGLESYKQVSDEINKTKNIHSYNKWFESGNIFKEIFLLKLIYLLFDLLLIIILYKLFQKINIIKIWSICPMLIYSIYMYGQFDIIPVTFIILSIYFYYKDKFYLSFFILGLAGMLKHFPFLLLPVYLILTEINFKQKLVCILMSIIPYILLSVPFITTHSYIQDIFINSGNYLNTVFIILYFIFLLILTKIKKLNIDNKNLLIKFCYIILSLFLITTKFHPQFIVWILPFLYILLFNSNHKNKIKLYFIITICYFIYINYLGKNSTWILFYPLDSNITNLPSLTSVFNRYIKLLNFNRIIEFSKILFNVILVYTFFIKVNNNEK